MIVTWNSLARAASSRVRLGPDSLSSSQSLRVSQAGRPGPGTEKLETCDKNDAAGRARAAAASAAAAAAAGFKCRVNLAGEPVRFGPGFSGFE
jgi:hypothetical protein